MVDSILTSIKIKLGIVPDSKIFDEALIMDINSAFFMLNQIGVGPLEPYTISDAWDVWDDFETNTSMELVKTYIEKKVRLMFDPPQSSYILDSVERQIKEYEFRLQVQAEKDLLKPADMHGVYDDD